ncbi:MAG: hypothetical protein PF444_09015 [Bacteroidales bacterium]|jgi:Na+-transporting NADH:ubiquinone oxidoreductase subunit NqrC|nr:hypothetical protein [Bacteroidales bacterium]
MKQLFFVILLSLNTSVILSNIYYVAVDGNDSDEGSIDHPLESIYKAQQFVNAGDTVYIRGGLYNMRMDQVSEYYSIWAYVT